MRKMLLAAAVATVGVAGLAGVNAVSANSDGETLADRLAARFNVSSSEVQEVLDEHRAERKADRQERKSQHLESLVQEGVITQEQLEALETKISELRDAKDELKNSDLSREEIRDELEQMREDFETWAEDQGIDLDEIKPERSGRKGGKFGHKHTDRSDNADDSTEETSEDSDQVSAETS
ncbi:MAG: hypothetical protein AAF413_00535 [Patescibacteria group bacterium]